MATQRSTLKKIHSKKLPIAGLSTVKQYSELARKLLRQAQELTSGEAPVSLQFNHSQCEYLVKKLDRAVQSARHNWMISVTSPELKPILDMENWKFMGRWKLLVRLAMDVQSFIQACCKEKHWIQAVSMLMNAFEHVASLSRDLELCIWSFENSNITILETALRRELITISDAYDRRLLDQASLLKKVVDSMNLETLSDLQERELASSLLGRLEAAVADIPNPELSDLAELSVRDQVNLLRKIAALSFESLSDPEERQLVTSLAKRFIASAVHPVSEKPDSDFMRVDCESIERERELGTGGCGTVYKVKWLGITAAEKAFPDQESEGDLPDFDEEVSILARQSHPNIVQMFCYVKKGVKRSIVLELMDKDLTSLINEGVDQLNGGSESSHGSRFSTGEVVDVMLQIAEGMEYLHRRRVLHRDLKPDNILVKHTHKLKEVDAEFIHAKVADFGISKTKERSITQTHPTWNIGTTRWMAPELIKCGCQTITGDWYPEWSPSKSDVYSFGMVSYEILTGQMPFIHDFPSAIKQKVLRDERPSLPHSCPSCLRSMIQKCWRPEPTERPTFAEISRELRVIKGSLLIGWDL